MTSFLLMSGLATVSAILLVFGLFNAIAIIIDKKEKSELSGE